MLSTKENTGPYFLLIAPYSELDQPARKRRSISILAKRICPDHICRNVAHCGLKKERNTDNQLLLTVERFVTCKSSDNLFFLFSLSIKSHEFTDSLMLYNQGTLKLNLTCVARSLTERTCPEPNFYHIIINH